MLWFRMYGEFATDSKVQAMDETLQRRFVMFLCLHCKGEFASLGPDELACALRISTDELARTVEVFKSKGFLDSNGQIRNWNKRQFKSDDVNARVKKHRDEKKKRSCNVTVSSSDTDTESDTEKKSEVSDTQRGVGRTTSRKRSVEQRGSRLPLPFMLTAEMRTWAATEAPHVDLEHATREFCDYWRSIPGQRGRKLDWVATWRNRIRECEGKSRTHLNGKSRESVSERFERIEREADAAGAPKL
jgi:hypothetical protein